MPLGPKPDGTFRFCTNYSKVNAVRIPDSYTLPRFLMIVWTPLGLPNTYVTALDLFKGYWQDSLTACASEISTFVTPDRFQQLSDDCDGIQDAE